MDEFLRTWNIGSGSTAVRTYLTTTTQPEEDGMRVFEYLVVYMGDDDWKGAKVLVGPTITIAADEEVVRMEAARKIPQSHANKLDDIDIYVRKWAEAA